MSYEKNTASFVETLLRLVPELRTVYDAHIKDNDTLLPHVFMGDVTRFAISQANKATSREALDRLMGHMEEGLKNGSEEVKELIVVSFVENLIETGTLKALHLFMGPNLKKEVAGKGLIELMTPNDCITSRLLLFFAFIIFGAGAYLFSPLHDKKLLLLFGPWAGGFLCISVLAGWTTIRLHSHKETRVIIFSFVCGMVGGFVGLVSGVLWGIFVSPSNLSPIIGFLITGPIGFIGGVVIGVGVGLLRNKK